MLRQDTYLAIIIALKFYLCDHVTAVQGLATKQDDNITKMLFELLSSGNLSSVIDDNLSPEEIEDIVHQYNSGTTNEDIRLNITQLIVKYGYPVEQHLVITDDGYILTVFRIPRNGRAVFLMHGLMCSADEWVTSGPESGLAYLLANEGYDVWIGNARGNKHSRNHKTMSPNKAEFWNFSWEEIGLYDLPAMIDYVLNYTGETKLKYVGHSQGTTSFFVMTSMRPKYNEKVSLMVALSAVAWMSRVKSPIVRFLAPISSLLHIAFEVQGIREFQMTSSMSNAMTSRCSQSTLAEILCGNIISLLCGYNPVQMNVTNFPVFLGHLPGGAATKQLLHYSQGILSGKFRRYDYSAEENKRRYRTEVPPDYPVEKITAPVAIFASNEDWLADIHDVEILRNKLSNVVEFYVPDKKFNHIDFIWAKDLKKLVFAKIIELFKKF